MQTDEQHERGLALENATRRDTGLPELTLEQYITAGYRYQDEPPSTQRATRTRTGSALDVAAIYRKLNTPVAESACSADRSSTSLGSSANGEAFATAIFERANAGHGHVPQNENARR